MAKKPPVEGLTVVRVELLPHCDVGFKLVFDDGSSLAFGFSYMYGDVIYIDPNGLELDYTEDSFSDAIRSDLGRRVRGRT